MNISNQPNLTFDDIYTNNVNLVVYLILMNK